MGLDTSHGCWHGAYSAFNRWRDKVAEIAGFQFKVHEGDYRPAPAIDWARYYDSGEFGNPLMGEWTKAPEDPLLVLLVHSDCDGAIHPTQAGALADRLAELAPLMPDEDGGGHIGHWRAKTQTFIDGLRLAAPTWRGRGVRMSATAWFWTVVGGLVVLALLLLAHAGARTRRADAAYWAVPHEAGVQPEPVDWDHITATHVREAAPVYSLPPHYPDDRVHAIDLAAGTAVPVVPGVPPPTRWPQRWDDPLADLRPRAVEPQWPARQAPTDLPNRAGRWAPVSPAPDPVRYAHMAVRWEPLPELGEGCGEWVEDVAWYAQSFVPHVAAHRLPTGAYPAVVVREMAGAR